MNKVTAKIDNQEFKFWDSIKLSRNIATFDTFAFGAPYEPDNSLLQNSFIPLSFKQIEIFVDDELFTTATILPVDPELSDNNRIAVSGYALPGILNDCSIPFDKYPLEFNNQTLEQIANTIAGFFDLSVVFTENSGAAFERVAIETNKKPFAFLIELAQQRGFLISNTEKGELKFFKASTDLTQSTTLIAGKTPLQSVKAQINPQSFYSSVTGLAAAPYGFEAESVTVENPLLSGVNRPFVYKVTQDLTGADLQKAVKWKAGTMFAAALRYSISVQGWRDENGDLWRPNKFINLTAPRAFVNKETTFLIENVNLNRGQSDTAELSLVLPESRRGEIPKTLPWL